MPDLQFEQTVCQQDGILLVAGVDEAGRGALAGPVVAGAVILPLNAPLALAALAEVDDSKQVRASKREELAELIQQYALAWGVGSSSAQQIDQFGIMEGTRRAMETAVSALSSSPHYLLIDGRVRLPRLNIPQRSIVRGDSLSLSIACASILAKVTRDRWMIEQDPVYPVYGFAQHKGYGTAQHRAALAAHGPCEIHRHSFAPIRKPWL